MRVFRSYGRDSQIHCVQNHAIGSDYAHFNRKYAVCAPHSLYLSLYLTINLVHLNCISSPIINSFEQFQSFISSSQYNKPSLTNEFCFSFHHLQKKTLQQFNYELTKATVSNFQMEILMRNVRFYSIIEKETNNLMLE